MPYPYPTLHIPFQHYDKNMTDLQETKESGTVYPFVVDTAIFLQADDYRMFWHEDTPDYPFMRELSENCLDPKTGKLHCTIILDINDPSCILLSKMNGKYYVASHDNFKQIDFSGLAWRCVSLSTKPPAKKSHNLER